MNLNFLFSLVLYTLIGVLMLLSFRIFIVTKVHSKIAQETYLSLQEKIVSEKIKQEQDIQKNAYLENYNVTLLNKLFEITKELLLTKKSILEEHYN